NRRRRSSAGGSFNDRGRAAWTRPRSGREAGSLFFPLCDDLDRFATRCGILGPARERYFVALCRALPKHFRFGVVERADNVERDLVARDLAILDRNGSRYG